MSIELVSESVVSAPFELIIMPQTSPLQVVQVSDTHLFADESQELLGLRTADSLQVVLDQIRRLQPKPDLMLLTGDLSQDETPESYQFLQRLLHPLDLPTYWLPGNHDRLSVMEQALSDAPMSSQKSFAAGGWNFILLNSTMPGKVYGQLSPGSLAWLEHQLQQLNPQPTVIGLHHPPFPVESDWVDQLSLRNAEAFFEVIDRYPQVQLVLFGHIHQEFDHQRNGVRYLGTPSTCVQFKPKSSQFALDEQQPGFRRLSLYPDGSYTTQVERVIIRYQLDMAAAGY